MIISVRSRKTVAIPDPNRNPERLKKAVHIVLVRSGRGQAFAHYFAPSVHYNPIATVSKCVNKS